MKLPLHASFFEKVDPIYELVFVLCPSSLIMSVQLTHSKNT
jgi:hypothetical protein